MCLSLFSKYNILRVRYQKKLQIKATLFVPYHFICKMNSQEDTTGFVPTMNSISDQITDHQAWLKSEAQKAENIVCESLRLIERSERCIAVPAIQINLRTLLKLIKQWQAKGLEATQEIKEGLALRMHHTN